jgi:hypothetical protein
MGLAFGSFAALGRWFEGQGFHLYLVLVLAAGGISSNALLAPLLCGRMNQLARIRRQSLSPC